LQTSVHHPVPACGQLPPQAEAQGRPVAGPRPL